MGLIPAYAGIGRRNAPREALDRAYSVGSALAERGFMLHSGGARGMDTAFHDGAVSVGGAVTVFRPIDRIPREARIIAERHHPNWSACKPFVRKLMARNVMIVMGAMLDDPVLAVLYWTEHHSTSGGTGHTLRVASSVGIPCIHIDDWDGCL